MAGLLRVGSGTKRLWLIWAGQLGEALPNAPAQPGGSGPQGLEDFDCRFEVNLIQGDTMRKLRIKRPSPALVIAVLALFVATSGSAYAAAKITTSQIAKHAVTQSKIAKQAVSTGKLKKEAVSTNKIEDDAVTSDKLGDQSVTGSKLADTSVGAKQFGSVVTRNTTTTVAASSNGTATALCQAGEKVIGGGFETPVTDTNVWVTQESVLDSAQNGWRISGRNFTAVPVQLTVNAYCLGA